MSSNGHVKLPFNQSHAFIIGINDYQHLTPLKTAVNDAKGLAERLEAQHGYIIHGPYLDSSKEELHRLFSEIMPTLVKKEDRILFYFAGHGIALDGDDGPNGYIVPKDAKQGDRDSLLPMNLLHDSINALPCQHGMLILDCCFSGAFKWSTGFRDVMFDLPKIIYEERFWRYVKDPAWQVITSSAYDQKAVDVISNQSIGMREEGEGIHSPFAKALFEAIDGAGDVIPADQGDGVITASELYAYLRDAVESETNEQAMRQSPSMFNLGRHDKGEFIFLNPRHRFNLPPTPDRNPFMGLASYEEADSNFFFGRDRVIDALVKKVKANQLTVVSGASGTGKSSVIKAGLLPKLRKDGWRLHKVIRPGKEPVQELHKEIGDLDKEINPEEPTLLIVDQYEELITQCPNKNEWEAFEKQLASWLEKHPNLHIILSVRSDFEPQFESKDLKKWWQAGRYVVPAFSLEEIREIITKPALQAILFYEPLELVDKLEEDVSQAPGALPLLSFTLSELYYAYLTSGRQDRSLSMEDYEKMGGVIGALRKKADDVYNNEKLNDADRYTMRKLMLRMVSLEGGELAGKRVLAEELIFSNETENNRIEKVSSELVEARLVLKGTDQQGRVYLEPAHDALVRAWARLWDWIKTTGEDKLIWQNKLGLAVNDYLDQKLNDPKKAKNLLWNDNPQLPLLKADIGNPSHGYNAKEESFIKESDDYRIRKRRNRRIGAAVIITIISGIAFYAFTQLQFGLTKKAESEARNLIVKARSIQHENRGLALNLAKLAWERTDIPLSEAQQALFEIYTAQMGKRDRNSIIEAAQPLAMEWFQQSQEPLHQARFSGDGESVFSLSQSGKLSQWDLKGVLIRNFSSEEDSLLSFQTSPDAQLILGCSAKGEVLLWNINGKLRARLQKDDLSFKSAFFASDGKKILTSTSKGIYSFWQTDGSFIKSIDSHLGLIQEVIRSENPQLTLARTRSGLQIWDTKNLKLKGNIFNDGRSSISSRGKYYWSSNSVSNLLWMTDPYLFPIEQDPGSTLMDVVSNSIETVEQSQTAQFSQNEKRVILPHYFHLQLYNLEEGLPHLVRELDYKVSSLTTLSPNGKHLVVSSDAGLFIHGEKGELILDLSNKSGQSKELTFSPDNLHFLSIEKGQAKLWNLNGEIAKELLVPGKEIIHASFSKSGKHILTQTQDGMYNLWGSLPGPCEDIQLPALISDLAVSGEEYPELLVKTIFGDSLSYNLEGNATLNQAKLWQTAYKPEFTTQSSGFQQIPSPKGSYTLSLEGTKAFLLNSEEEIIAEIAQHTDQLELAAFSQDEKYFFTSGRDGSLKVWPTPQALYNWMANAPLANLTYLQQLIYLEDFEALDKGKLSSPELIEMAHYYEGRAQEDSASAYFERAHELEKSLLSMRELRKFVDLGQEDFYSGTNLTHHLQAALDSCDGKAIIHLLNKVNADVSQKIPPLVKKEIYSTILGSMYNFFYQSDYLVHKSKNYPMKCMFVKAEKNELEGFEDEYDFQDSLMYAIQPFIYKDVSRDPVLLNIKLRLLLYIDFEKEAYAKFRFDLDSLQTAWLGTPEFDDLEFINDLLNDTYDDLVLIGDDYDGNWIMDFLPALLNRLNEIKEQSPLPIFTSLEPLLKIYLFAEIFDASLKEDIRENGIIQGALNSRNVHELRIMSHAINQFVATREFSGTYMEYGNQMLSLIREIDSISLYERLTFIDTETEELLDLQSDSKSMLYAAQYFIKNENKSKARVILEWIPRSDKSQISLNDKVEVLGYEFDNILLLAQSSKMKEFSDAIELLKRKKRIALYGVRSRTPKGKPTTYFFGDYFTTSGVVLDKNMQAIPEARVLFWDWGNFFSNEGDLEQKEVSTDSNGKFELKSHSLRLKIEAEGFASQIMTIENPSDMQLIVLEKINSIE